MSGRVKRLRQVPAIRTGAPEADRALDALRTVVNEMLLLPRARAILRVRLDPGVNRVPHGIGEVPATFTWTTDVDGAVVSNAQRANPTPDKTLWVRLSGAMPANAVLTLF